MWRLRENERPLRGRPWPSADFRCLPSSKAASVALQVSVAIRLLIGALVAVVVVVAVIGVLEVAVPLRTISAAEAPVDAAIVHPVVVSDLVGIVVPAVALVRTVGIGSVGVVAAPGPVTMAPILRPSTATKPCHQG